MSDFLIQNAIDTVWCDPSQDFEHIFQPTRITDPRGVLGSFDFMWGSVVLPTNTDRYHVYQIGQVNPASLGLIATTSTWSTLASISMDRSVYCNVYTKEGLQFPLSESYAMVTRDRTLIFAIKEQTTIAPLRTTPIYFRFYANAYYASRRSDAYSKALKVGFYRYVDIPSALQFQYAWQQAVALPGFTALYVNGAYQDSFIPMTLSVGDTLEYVYDPSVKKVVDFSIGDLQTFDSVMDAKKKYLLHYAGPQAGDVSIDYRDDCDLYLFKATGGATPSIKGVYFHKNQNDALRQLTHRDYSVPVPYVAAYQVSQPTWGDITALTLRLVIRNAGFDRPLTFEAHDIHELYKLPEDALVKAFLGIDSNVGVWRAPALESSSYIAIMDADINTIDRSMVEAAYGYNAISKLLGDTPMMNPPVYGAYLNLPPVLQQNSTAFEYDPYGRFSTWYPHVLGAQYTPTTQHTTYVEMIAGLGSSQLDMVFDQQDVALDPLLSYRYYVTDVFNGEPNTANWQDVTGDTSKYQIVNGKLHWLVDTNVTSTCVKSDGRFLVYGIQLAPQNGLLKFTVNALVSHPTGQSSEALTIPPGQLDVWLNNRPLIEDLDYYVQWPQVVLVNKAYLLASPSAQSILIRCTGFCRSDMSREPVNDASFIRWGALSHNDTFNLRDDRVIRIIANGRLYHRSEVVFAEDQASASIPGLPNGAPYQIQNQVVPVRGFCDQDTYALRAASQATDMAVAQYLSLKIPDTTPTEVDIIPAKYPVYSPFISTILNDVVSGILSMTPFMGFYSTQDIRNAVAPYLYLLDYDPAQKGVDTLHVVVEPHQRTDVMALSIYQWQFISRVVETYLPDKIDLSSWVSITPQSIANA